MPMKNLYLFFVTLVVTVGATKRPTTTNDKNNSNDNIPAAVASYINQHVDINELFKETINSTQQQPNEVSLRKLATGSSPVSSFPVSSPKKSIDDFEDFNNLFRHAVIKLPDTVITDKVLGTKLTLKFRNMICTNMEVGDIILTGDKQSNTKLSVNLAVTGVKLDCFIDYRYDYGLLRGSGSVDVYTLDNAVSTRFSFASLGFDNHPPNNVKGESCSSVINVVDLDISGTLLSRIVDTYERRLRGTVEDEVQKVACDELGTLIDKVLKQLVEFADETLEPYLEANLPEEVTDPLNAEKNLVVPDDINLLDLQDTENVIGTWFNALLEELDALLGTEVTDDRYEGVECCHGCTKECWRCLTQIQQDQCCIAFGVCSGDTGRDLGVNVFLRQNLLDDDRSFTTQIPEELNVIFDDHDLLTQTTITLDQVKIYGLDTFTKFEPLIGIGQYTLQNELAWKYLTTEMDLTIDIKPSTLPDSVLVDPDPDARLVEKVRISFGIDDVDAVVSVLLAVDQTALGELKIGSLLFTEQILPCALSALYQLEITGIDGSIRDIREPILDGFVSNGIDRVVTEAADIFFEMYQSSVLKAIPAILQTTLRDIVNDKILVPLLNDAGSNCPEPINDNGLMDFRDLLLPPNLAYLLGGKGTKPYGNLAPKLLDLLRDQFFAQDDDGYLAINSLVIAPTTEKQSGVAGMLRFPNSVISFIIDEISNEIFASLVDKFVLDLSDMRLQHLDTLSTPVSVLQPGQRPTLLGNYFTMKPVSGQSISASMKLLLALDGSPINMYNELDITANIDLFAVGANFLAPILASRFLHFPLKDVMNVDCWMATIQAPLLDKDGFSVEDSPISLALHEIAMQLSNLDFQVECSSCSSPGLDLLPSLLNIMTESSMTQVLNDRAVLLLQEVLQSDWLQTQIDRWIVGSPGNCPHIDVEDNHVADAPGIDSPHRRRRELNSNYDPVPFPDLSDQGIDTIVSAMATVLQFAAVIAAESARLSPPSETNALSAQDALDDDVALRLVDWTNLDGTIGSLVDLLLKEAKDFLESMREDKTTGSTDLGINVFLREQVLDEHGDLVIPIRGVAAELPGFTIHLNEIRIHGLDTISTIELLEPIAAQTLRNAFKLNEISIEIGASVTNTLIDSRYEVSVGVSMSDIEATIPLFLGLNSNILGSYGLGSFLDLKQIFVCLLSALHGLEATQMLVSVGEITLPTVTGLMDDTKAAFETFTESLTQMYAQDFVDSLPALCDGLIRELLNGIAASYVENSVCDPITTSASSFINFNDFFSGKSDLYGSLPSLVKDLIDTSFFKADSDTGLLRLNDALITPFTENQSGVEGMLRFASTFVDLIIQDNDNNDGDGDGDGDGDDEDEAEIAFFDQLQLQVSDARIGNVNTFAPPAAVLEPSPDAPNMLGNNVGIGISNLPLTGAIRFLLNIEGEDTPFNMRNELDFSASIDSTRLSADVLATIYAQNLLSFPLEKLLDVNCWLSTLPLPQIDADGFKVDGSHSSLSLEKLDLNLTNLQLGAKCISCTSPGLDLLPELMELINGHLVTKVLGERIVLLMSEVLEGEWLQTHIDRWIFDNALTCLDGISVNNPSIADLRSDPRDNIKAITSKEFAPVPIPALSDKAIDTLFFAGLVVVETGIIIVAESQRHIYDNTTNALSAQEAFDPVDRSTIFNWMEMSGSIGALINVALTQAREYLGSTVTDDATGASDLGINQVLQDQLLDEDRMLIMDLSDLELDLSGVVIGLDEVRLAGLDTIKKFEILNPIAEQTLQNTIVWEEIKVEFDLTATSSVLEFQKVFSFEFSIRNIEVIVPLFIALDTEILGNLGLGSFLEFKNILSCLLSSLAGLEITQLDVSIGEIDFPQVSGLLPDTQEVNEQYSTALSEGFGEQFLEAIPMLFNGLIRESLNSIVGSFINDAICDEPNFPSNDDAQQIDFRQFFDSDMKPYGDVPILLMNLIESELLSASSDDSELAAINDFLIAPLTKRQSGEDGVIGLDRQILGIGIGIDALENLGIDLINIQAFDPAISNLDSVTTPITLLKPNEENGSQLDNSLGLGVDSRPLKFGIKGLLAMAGDPALETHNEVELSVNFIDVELFLSILAQINANRFMKFPLQDVTNTDCWLALPETPILTDGGFRTPESDITLGLDFISLVVGAMRLDVGCTNCTSPGFSILPQILHDLEEKGVSNVLERELLDFAETFLRTDYLQTFIDRLLVDAAQQCPHSPQYTADPIDSQEETYPPVPFPSLSNKSIEAIAFASIFIFQVGAVVIAENFAAHNIEERDPLALQDSLDLDNIRLMDFTDLGSSIGEWAGVGIAQVNSFLMAPSSSSSGDKGGSPYINELVRSLFLNNDGNLALKFDDLTIGNDDINVSLKKVQITGLDSINAVNALDAIGPQTLKNEVQFDSLGLEVVVSMGSSSSPPPETANALRFLQQEENDLTLSLVLNNVSMSLSLLLALDLDRLGSLELSSILDMSNILPCFLSANHLSDLSELKMSFEKIETFSVVGFNSAVIDQAVTASSALIVEKYGELIGSSLPGFVDSTVRVLINNWMRHYTTQEPNSSCSSVQYSANDNNFVDFRELFGDSQSTETAYGDLFHNAIDIIDRLVLEIDPMNGLSSVNDLIGPLTRSQSNTTGSILFPGDIFDQRSRLRIGGLKANIKLQAKNARIDNLDTVGQPLALLDTISNFPHELNNTASIGLDGRPLRFAINFFFALKDDVDDINLENDLDISLDLHGASVMLQVLMKIAETRFYGFPLRDILDYNCWLATMPAPSLDEYGIRYAGTEPSAALTNLAVSIQQLKLNIRCVSCSSPGMDELTQLLSSPEGADDATEVANRILGYVTTLLGGQFLQVQLDRLISDAARKCPHSAMYEPEAQAISYKALENARNDGSTPFLLVLGLVVVALILAVGFVMFVVRFTVRKRHRRWIKNLPYPRALLLSKRQKREDQIEAELNAATTSMFQNPDIPKYVRWLMPVVIIGNIGFFLSGHLSLGATVNIEAELAGESFRVEKFFEFSMARSAIDIWEAGGRELAIMLLIFSGIFPYTKQMITLALWFLPPSRLGITSRGSALLWLDWLAKWSMVDIFVLVISIASFRVSILSPDVKFLPKDFYSVDLLVVPLWGLYANMTAQLISQISSHFIIHYHRRIVEQAQKAYNERYQLDARTVTSGDGQDAEVSSSAASTNDNDANNIKKTRLCNQAFARPHRGESERLVVRRDVHIPLVLCGVVMTTFVLLGCILPSFSLDILGIIGVAVESGQQFDDATTYHNVFTLLKLLIEEARFLDYGGAYIGLGTLCTLVFITVLIVPIIQIVALLVQWFMPVTRKMRNQLSVAIEILQAWQYAEVYLMSIFAASWQLGPISEVMINDYCDGLEATFSQLVYYGILTPDDAQCFRVDSRIEKGFFMLAAAAIILALINTFVVKAVIQYSRDQDEEKQRALEARTKLYELTDGYEVLSDNDLNKIKPTKVLFTDTFRYLLQREAVPTIIPPPDEAFQNVEHFDEPNGNNNLQSQRKKSFFWSNRLRMRHKSLEPKQVVQTQIDKEIPTQDNNNCQVNELDDVAAAATTTTSVRKFVNLNFDDRELMDDLGDHLEILSNVGSQLSSGSNHSSLGDFDYSQHTSTRNNDDNNQDFVTNQQLNTTQDTSIERSASFCSSSSSSSTASSMKRHSHSHRQQQHEQYNIPNPPEDDNSDCLDLYMASGAGTTESKALISESGEDPVALGLAAIRDKEQRSLDFGIFKLKRMLEQALNKDNL